VLPAASWERSLPAWAALGPHAHPRRHLPWPHRGRPPGRQARPRPPTVVAPPSPRTAATRHAATSRCRLLPCPPRRRPRRRGPPQLGGPGRHRPPSDQRDCGSVAPRPGLLDRRRAVDGPAATGASTRSGGQGPRPPRPGPQRHRLRWKKTDASGMVGADSRRLDTARVDSRQLDSRRLDAGRVDSRRPTAGLSGRRPQVTGHRTAGQPDPGRRNRMGGHRMGGQRRPTPWLVCWQGRPRRRRPTPRYRLEAPPADAVRASNNQDRAAARTPRAPTLLRTGLASAATVSCRWSAPSSWRLGALLSSDEFRIERRANGDASSVMTSAEGRRLGSVGGQR
jgi:hypothetical protein